MDPVVFNFLHSARSKKERSTTQNTGIMKLILGHAKNMTKVSFSANTHHFVSNH